MVNKNCLTQVSDEFPLPSAGWLGDFPPRKWHLLLAGVCIAAVYLVGVTGQWWPTPDSALYLGLGRSLAEGDGYRFNGLVHNIVTPGLPMILAGLRIIFGDGFWAPNLFMALCGLTSLLMAYLTVARLSDRRMALAVALATALSHTYFFNSHRILTDTPFVAIFWAILYTYIRYRSGSTRWLIPMGLLTAAAIAVRAPGVMVLGPLAIGLMLDRPSPAGPRRRRIPKGLLAGAVILAVIAAVGSGFYMLAQAATGKTPLYVGSLLSQAKAGGWAHYLQNLPLGLMQLPLTVSEMLTSQETYFIGLPALLLIIVGAVSLWRRGQRFVLLLVLMSVLALAFCGRDQAIRPRYLMPLQPLLLLALMEGLCWSIRRFYRPAGAKLLLKAVGVLVGVIIACNAPKLLRNAVYYSYLSHTPRYYQVVNDGEFAELFEVAEIIRHGHSDGRPVATNSDDLSVLHFLGERVITPFPKTARLSPADTEKIHHFVTSRGDLKFIVLDVEKQGGGEPFHRRLKELFENTPSLKLQHDGKRYRVYEKVAL